MRGGGVVLLACVMAGLGAVLIMELRAGSPSEIASVAGNPTAAGVAPSAAASAAVRSGRQPSRADEVEIWAATSLARPLFAPNRRPPLTATGAPQSSAPAALLSLPRVSGILVSGTDRRAIFVAGASPKPVVAGVGDRVGSFRVEAIEPSEVTLSSSDGTFVLHPGFGRASAASPEDRRPGSAPVSITSQPDRNRSDTNAIARPSIASNRAERS